MAEVKKQVPLQSAPPTRGELLRALRPRLLLAAGKRMDRFGVAGDPEDVVQGAILALLDGKCPTHVSIEKFLYKKIRNIVYNSIRHHVRVPTTFLEDPDLRAEFASDPPAQEETVDQRRLLDQVFQQLITAADGKRDAAVSLMLAEYRDGNHDRASVAEALELSPRQHDDVRRRLDTLCRNLPPDLRTAASELLGISL